MKLTNRLEYPESVVKAVRNDSYNKGDCDFSCTELIGPARIRVLTKAFYDQLETDVDDELFKLYGQIGHGLIERAGDSLTHVVEKRLFGEINGTRISAQIDSLSLVDGVLTDWKFTTVYGFKSGTPPKPEWVAQLNIQLELLRMNGMDASKLQICGILRDWRPAESKREKGYPNKIGIHAIPMWTRAQATAFIVARIKAHTEAFKTLPQCTPDEHWGGNRCAGYCAVSKHCDQYKQSKEAT